jgi:hypothetical protein
VVAPTRDAREEIVEDHDRAVSLPRVRGRIVAM